MMEQCSAMASSAQMLAFEGQRCCDNCVTSCVWLSDVALHPTPTHTDIKAARFASELMCTAGLVQLVPLNLPRATLVEGQPPRIIAFHDNAGVKCSAPVMNCVTCVRPSQVGCRIAQTQMISTARSICCRCNGSRHDITQSSVASTPCTACSGLTSL
jgi:hypothetical protein